MTSPGSIFGCSPHHLINSMRIRIFIDFWNFSLNWNQRTSDQCDWKKLPLVLTHAAQSTLSQAGLGTLSLEETRVYASYEPGREEISRAG